MSSILAVSGLAAAVASPVAGASIRIGNGTPGAPSRPTAMSGDAQVTLNWLAPSPGACSIQGYNIYQGTTSNGETGPVNGSLDTSTTYTATGLTNGVTYYFRVAAVNCDGQGALSNQVQATPSNANVSVTMSVNNSTPNSGTNVTYTIGLRNSGPSPATGVTVTDSLPAGFTYVSSTSTGGGVAVAGNTVTWTLNTVAVSAHFTATITATATGNGTPVTNTATESQTNGDTSGTQSASATVTPVVPSGVVYHIHCIPGNGQVTVAWGTPVNDGGAAPTSYNVYLGTTAHGVGETYYATVSAPTTQITVTGLTNGTMYYFGVTAVNQAGPGTEAQTNAYPYGAPDAPIAGTASSPSKGEITVTWSPPASDNGYPVTGYEVYMSTTSGGELSDTNPTLLSSSAGSHTFSGLTTGTTYYFVVEARNPAGWSPPSGEMSATAS